MYNTDSYTQRHLFEVVDILAALVLDSGLVLPEAPQGDLHLHQREFCFIDNLQFRIT